MAIQTPIVDIPINDKDFRAFIDLFNDYKAKLAQLPGEWSKVGKATEAAGDAGEGLADAAGTTASHSEDIVKNFQEMTAALMAQAELHRRIDAQERATDNKRKQERDAEAKAEKSREAAQKRYEASVNKTNAHFKEMRSNITGAVSGIASAATDVLKFVGLGGIAGGLLGAGGLFGLDRLADSASNGRRSAQGLDTSIGGLKAFANIYGAKAVDAGSYLSNIETVAKTPGLQYGVGGRIAQLSNQGLDTADIGAALIPYIKQTFLQNGGNATALKTSGLDNVVSLQDAIRISKLSDTEIAEIAAKYQKGKAQLAVSDPDAKAFQDLKIQIDNASGRIESVLIKDLDKLAPVIAHLSDEAVDLVDKWTKELVPAIDKVAAYLDSDDFKKDLKSGAEAAKEFADGALEAARTLGLISRPGSDPGATTFGGDTARAFGYGSRPVPGIDSNHTISMWNATHPNEPQVPINSSHPAFDDTTPQQYERGFDPNHPNAQLPFSWWNPGSYQTGDHAPGTAPWEKSSDRHNPFNLRPVGKGGFRSFGSDDEGVRGAYNQIERDINVHHLKTLKDLIGDPTWGWAPAKDGNNVDAYLKKIAQDTGYGADTKLDGGNTDQIAAIMASMGKVETRANYTPAQVRLVINNNTGGSAVVSTSQLVQ